MAIQFLDMMVSQQLDSPSGTTVLTTVPLLIGDLGVSTSLVVGTPNQDKVRVGLSGTVGILHNAKDKHDKDKHKDKKKDKHDHDSHASVLFTIERGGNGTFGSGTVIYQEEYRPVKKHTSLIPVSITTTDFPPSAAAAQSLIRYTLYVALDVPSEAFILTGPIAIYGVAVAGFN
ncbi:hypothetical protein ACFPVX_12680 [Cohnella faecalis]|uniref:Uncharacterized protein n=1 Tax=Cohnella faecalis TaxID=2315694 RepID=A0A398CVM8_9BACL|nr:hypothetical protein [Cohnella faecalis]RIE03271.1 hypothetical protein D3H35_11305 [Cohnella faecalis]